MITRLSGQTSNIDYLSAMATFFCSRSSLTKLVRSRGLRALASFYFAFLSTWTLSRHITTQKGTWPISGHLDLTLGQYSYFEKGCRKKCTRQFRKVLWVVLSALFFKEIWKNGTRGHGHMFASAKGKQQKYVRQLQSSGTVYWSYPILPFGIVACTFFQTSFLEIAVYWLCGYV